MVTTSPSFASTQYGAPIGEYRGGVARVIVGIAGAVTLIIGVFFLVVPPTTASAIGDTAGVTATIVSGLIWVAAALYCFWTLFSWRGARAQLFERGFTIARVGKTTAARWEDIASVTQKIVRVRSYGIPVWTSHVYTLSLANGETVRVNNAFGKTGKLGDTIQQMSANALLPRAIASFHGGASLPFGRISLSQAGISNGRETVPWNNINQLTLRDGKVVITRKDRRLTWVTIPVAKTPNIYVLTALVSYIQRGAR